jgi:uncharacterized protein DUF2637
MTPVAKHPARMSGDQMRRTAMWILASGVAAIAAIVSYSHIYDLGRAHGGTGVAARLLPLSVDMLILVGELMLLHEADTKGRRFVLGWVLVWSGILATLAANVTYGAQFGLEGAVIWGWPAYSFILAAAGMVSVVKRSALAAAETVPDVPQVAVATPAVAATLPTPEPATSADTEGDAEGDTAAPGTIAFPSGRNAGTTARQPSRRKTARVAQVPAIPSDVDTQAEALRILADHPDIAGSELGLRLGKTPGYGRTLKRKLAGSVAGPDSHLTEQETGS